MFILVTEIAAPWPVSWKGVSNSGEVVDLSCTLTFRRIGTAEFRALFEPGELAPADVAAHNRRLFDRLVVGWQDVVDGAGAPLPFADPAIGKLLDFPGFAEAFGAAYTRFWLAIPEEREKNSGPSRAGGRAATADRPTADPATIAPRSNRRSARSAPTTP